MSVEASQTVMLTTLFGRFVKIIASKFGQMKKKDYFCIENVLSSRTANSQV